MEISQIAGRVEKTVYVPILKKGDPRECKNNRAIALISQASKILLIIIKYTLESRAPESCRKFRLILEKVERQDIKYQP